MQEVLEGVKVATKGTSKVPELLSSARTTDDMKFVLENLNKPEFQELARKLAATVLNATNADAVASAFSEAKFEMTTNGVEDPEQIMIAKIQSQVDTFVTKAELALSEIKNNFNASADAAKSADELDKAL